MNYQGIDTSSFDNLVLDTFGDIGVFTSGLFQITFVEAGRLHLGF